MDVHWYKEPPEVQVANSGFVPTSFHLFPSTVYTMPTDENRDGSEDSASRRPRNALEWGPRKKP